MAEHTKTLSPLVRAVVALDGYFSELERLGQKISEIELRSDFDSDQMQKLLTRFAECGEGVATEIIALSQELNHARARADQIAQAVGAKAKVFGELRHERTNKMEAFRILGEKVRELSLNLNRFQRPAGETLSEADQAQLKSHMQVVQSELVSLIEEAQVLRKDGQTLRMKTLEQNADSLAQTLVSIQNKIQTMNLSPGAPELLN